MKKYIGTKQVSATPAWRIDGKVYPKDGEVPRSMNREDGYKVVYEDGYESWSPAAAFEKAYRVADTFLDRLRIERDDLSLRYNKAQDFYYSPKFKELLWPEEQQAFETQLDLMRKYLAVLDARIQYAENKLKTCKA